MKYPLIRLEQPDSGSGLPGGTDGPGIAMVADHVLVKVPQAIGREQVEAAFHGLGYQPKRWLTSELVLVTVAEEVNAMIDAVPRATQKLLTSLPGIVEFAEPDYVVYAVETLPNDLDARLWGLHNTGQHEGTVDADLDAPLAWDVTVGSSDVIVGVIDTGVDYAHPDLAANLWTNPGEIPDNGIDDDCNCYVDDVHGWNFYADNNHPMDDHFHGTHCAGTIGAAGDNGIGVTGVCQQVSIMPLKFLNHYGSGFGSDAILAVQYATMMRADLTSNSWGGGPPSDIMYYTIEAARARNILFVAAAGNSSLDNDVWPHYPSSYTNENVIAVAASDRNDNLSSFSCFGLESVDLAAPGSDIYSTFPTWQTLAMGFYGLPLDYATISGTSMATPHVAGVCALLRAQFPRLSAAGIKERLLATVDPLPALAGKTVTGGRVNAYGALTGSPASDNNAPQIDWLPSREIRLPDDSVSLAPDVYDDGRPGFPGTLSYQWSVVTGPAPVTFSTPTAKDTVATFTTRGEYVLELAASDGELESSAQVAVTVLKQILPPPPGIIAYWDLDGDLTDQSGNGYDAVQTSGSFSWLAEAPLDECAAMDGVAVARAQVDKELQTWTLACWARSTGTGGTMVSLDGIFELNWADPAHVGVTSSRGDASSPFGALLRDRWYHLAAAYDGLSLTLWVDGEQVSRQNVPPGVVLRSPFAVTLASGHQGTFSGAMDDIRIYGEPLTGKEVGWLYELAADQNSAPTVDAGDYAVLHWPLQTLTLTGTVQDDGFPLSRPMIEWTQVSGPGTVSFADSGEAQTEATFSATGLYTLQLTAGDGIAATAGAVNVLVQDGSRSAVEAFTVPTAPSDMVYDGKRGILYLISEDGMVARFNAATREFDTSVAIGGKLHAGDITADARYLYMADLLGPADLGRIPRLDLDTDAVTYFTYDLYGQETGCYDIAIGPNGKAMFTGAAEGPASGSIPFRELDLTTHAVGYIWAYDDYENYFVLRDTVALERSRDRTRMLFAEKTTTSGRHVLFDMRYRRMRQIVELGLSTTSCSAINADGSMYATETFPTYTVLFGTESLGGLCVYDADLRVRRNLMGIDGGAAFHPTDPVLFGVDIVDKEMVALDLETGLERYRLALPTAETLHTAVPYQNGHIEISPDGLYLFYYNAHTLFTIDLPQALPPQEPITVDDFYVIDMDTELNAASVLDNDTDRNPEDVLQASLVTPPANADSFALNSDGTFSYTPLPGYSGEDQFTYGAGDGQTTVHGTARIQVRQNPQESLAIPVLNVRDLIYDDQAQILYMPCLTGQVERFSLGQRRLLPPIPVAGQLNRGDLTASGGELYVADVLPTFGEGGVLYRIDAATGDYAVLQTSEGEATWDVKVMADGMAYVTPSGGMADANLSIVRLSDGKVDRLEGLELPTVTDFRRANLCRSGDREVLCLTEGSLTWWHIIRGETRTLPTVFNNTGEALNNDGSLIAAQCGPRSNAFHDDYLAVFTPAPEPLASFVKLGGGQVFADAASRLYAVDVHRDELVAISTNHWAEAFRTPVGESLFWDPDVRGIVACSDDGADVFLKVDYGVRWLRPAAPPDDLPPMARDDFYTVGLNATRIEPEPRGILANDSDPEGETLTAALVASPIHGSLSISPDGSFSYTPDTDYTGPDSFVYEVTDGQSPPRQATVRLHVLASLSAAGFVVPVDDARDVVFSPDGSMLYISTDRGSIERYDPQLGMLLRPFGAGDKLRGMDINEDGSRLYVAGQRNVPGKRPIWSVDTVTGEATTLGAEEHKDSVSADVSVMDGNKLYAAYQDQLASYSDPALVMFDLETGEPFLAAGGTNDAARCWRSHDRSVAIHITYRDCRIVSASDDSISFFADIEAGPTHRASINHDNSVFSVSGALYNMQGARLKTLPAEFLYGHFDPVEEVIYGIDPTSDELVAVSVSHETVYYRATLGTDFPTSMPAAFEGGEMAVAGDGSLAAVTVSGGVSVCPLQTPLPNLPPEGKDDFYLTSTDTPVATSAPGVLANDSDLEGQTLTATIQTLPQNGSLDGLSVGAAFDGSFTYTPNPGYTGDDEFTYQAYDGIDHSATLTVRIRVRANTNAAYTIPVNGPRDVVWAPDHRLFITTERGVLPFNSTLGSLEPRLDPDVPLLGVDRCGENGHLYAAVEGKAEVHRLDVTTGMIEILDAASVDPNAKGIWDLKFYSGSLALLTGDGAYGSAWLGQLDAVGNTVQRKTGFNASFYGDDIIAVKTGLSGASLAPRILLGNSGMNYRNILYDGAHDMFSPVVDSQHECNNAIAATNRDGTISVLYASTWWTPYMKNVLLVFDGNFGYVGEIAGLVQTIASSTTLNGATAFDPFRPLLYVADVDSEQIIAVNTGTWTEEYRIDVDRDVLEAVMFERGTMRADAEGLHLALTFADGVMVIPLPNSTDASITLAKAGDPGASLSPGGGTHAGAIGTPFAIGVTPSAGYVLDRWELSPPSSGALGDNYAAVTTFTPWDPASTVTAVMIPAPATVQLIVDADTGLGTIIPGIGPVPSPQYGATYNLEASPGSAAVFGGWELNGAAMLLADRADPQVSVRLLGDATAKATFLPEDLFHQCGTGGRVRNCYDAAGGDLDGDGDMDIALVYGGSPTGVQIMLNTGSGEMVPGDWIDQAPGLSGYYLLAAIEDLDGDLDADILLTSNYQSSVWLNDGAGGFTFQGDLAGSTSNDYCYSVTLADADRDGDFDAFIGRRFNHQLLLNNGSGGFSLSTKNFGGYGRAVMVDLTGDGAAEVVTTSFDGPCKLFRNNGTGSFNQDSQPPVPTSNGGSVYSGDFNGDAIADLLVLSSTSGNKVWINDGNAVFAAGSHDTNLGYCAIADFDGDGDTDIVGSKSQGGSNPSRSTLFLNDGTGDFVETGLWVPTDPQIRVLLSEDFDGSGTPDLYDAGTHPTKPHVWLNDVSRTVEISSATIDENEPPGTPVGELSADIEAVTTGFTFGLVDSEGNADNAYFDIAGTQLVIVNAMDAEQRTVYQPTVGVYAGGQLVAARVFWITVQDINEPPSDVGPWHRRVAADVEDYDVSVGLGSDPEGDYPEITELHLAGVVGEVRMENQRIYYTAAGRFDHLAEDEEYVDTFTFTIADPEGLTGEGTVHMTVVGRNDVPTGITCIPDEVQENLPAGTIVGTLGSIDPDINDVNTFEILSEELATPVPFVIIQGDLVTTEQLDHETAESYAIPIRLTDGDGVTLEQWLTVHVADQNERPSHLLFAFDGLPLGAPTGTPVGNLELVDTDLGDLSRFSLVSGPGDVDNGSFDIHEGELLTVGNRRGTNAAIRLAGEDSAGNSREVIVVFLNSDQAQGSVSFNILDYLPAAQGWTVTEMYPAEHGAVSSDGTEITYALAPGYVGSDSFQAGAEDGIGNQERFFVNVTIETVPTGGDTDGDGLDDGFEQRIIDADPDDAIETLADVLPGDDFDNDSNSNRTEEITGTDATDTSDALVLRIDWMDPTTGEARLSLSEAKTGVVYHIYCATDCRAADHLWTRIPELTLTPAEDQHNVPILHTDPVLRTAPTMFWRVTVERAPE